MIIEYIIITLMLACVGVVMLGAIVSKMLADEVVRRANK